jgi:SAM-dependent methyltransferase
LEIIWGERAARWFVNASEYTGYHRELADILLAFMQPGGTLCDLGCGIGLIDFALADHLKQITCVDISAEALEILEAEAARRRIGNITALRADAATLEGQWDDGLMLFFHGTLTDNIAHFLRLFRRRLFYIVHADPIDPQRDHRPERTKCSSVSAIQGDLDRQRINYQLFHHALEYGQPFGSLEEAIDFTRAYRLCPQGKEEGFLKARLRPAQKTREGYQYYLPHTKRFGMFIIGREDNAHI